MIKYGKRRRWIMEVALKHTSEACLLWPFSIRGQNGGTKGYPALNGGYGHTLLCKLVNGEKPTPQHETEHICGTSLCMNPQHVRWATHRENCARRTNHGTQTIGEQHGMAKLTEQQVLQILVSKAPGVVLAAEYGVTPAMICRIRKRKAWKHLV